MSGQKKSEARIQQEMVIWFHNTYPEYRGLLFHVPNEGTNSALRGKIMKATGVIAGVSDLILVFGSTIYCFEVKTDRGRQSPKQATWQELVEEQGIAYFIVRDVSLFSQIVNTIII